MKTMMNQKLLLTIAASCFLAACGEYSKEPVADIDQLRADARTFHENGPAVPEVIYRDRPVKEEVEVPVYISAPSSDDISIDAGRAVHHLTVGVETKFKVTVSSSRPGVKVELAADSRPDGSTFREIKPGEYEFSWKPSAESILEDELVQYYEVVFTPTVTEAKTPEEKTALNGIINQTTTGILVYRTKPASQEVSK